MRIPCSFAVGLALCICGGQLPIAGQPTRLLNQADKNNKTPEAVKETAADAKTEKNKTALAADKAVSIALASPQEVEGDYIPCKFTLGQLRSLVAPEIASTLTAADSERLKEKVIAAAAAGGPDTELKGSPLYAFTFCDSRYKFPRAYTG